MALATKNLTFNDIMKNFQKNKKQTNRRHNYNEKEKIVKKTNYFFTSSLFTIPRFVKFCYFSWFRVSALLIIHFFQLSKLNKPLPLKYLFA